MDKKFKKIVKNVARFLFGILIIFLLFFSLIQPSNDRNWTLDQKVLSYGIFEGELVHMKNIRNFSYSTMFNYTPSYYNQTFNLSELNSVDYIIEQFYEWEGAAHTLLSFGFENGDYLVISVEIRKEIGEGEFSPLKGLFKEYELMYVIGSEQDLIKLRTNYRNDTVFVYPVKTTKENMRLVFINMIKTANELKESPKFYNTLTASCTTEIVGHVNTISKSRIPRSLKILAPGYSDKLAYDLDLIVKKGTLEETREYYRINDLALEHGNSSNFSQWIRLRH